MTNQPSMLGFSDALPPKSAQEFRQIFEKRHAAFEAMTPEQREAYWADYEKRQREIEQRELEQIRGRTLANRIKFSGIPEEFRAASVEILGPSIQAYAHAVECGGYESLFLRGPVGTGKTTAACAILNRAVMRRTVRFVTMRRLATLVNDVYVTRQRSRSEVFDEFANVDVLVVDDLGKELTVGNIANTVLMIWELVDTRWAEHRPTIITSQYDSQELFQALIGRDGDTKNARAIVDRLGTYTSEIFDGESHRRQAKFDFGEVM